ncbi:MAG: hypothetical protein A2W90_04995 [Bacteroidetes bacterium GWF2_42_66]|nr:MAG: hypothetical protein A2W89_21215 [Bacteroidetes bacterium GWE2_42_39]OFY40842.1 MAG: hypothetical protein A2W90_04995 [Bacteroidetes bacterium GWF2_42_66]HBL75863.1 hypothetical protein [Prolixibacteraceae bacterium]HCU63112.1 hypothetical protein [Prolixibacteraceae bacterium]
MIIITTGAWFRCPLVNIVIKAKKPDYRPFPKELKTYGDHIRQARLQRNLYQSKVAEIIGVSTPEVIKDWELNHSKPQIQYIPKIISFLGYSPDIYKNPVKRYRIERGITQEDFARTLGIDPGTLARIEAGRGKRINMEIKKRIENMMRMS